MTDIDVFAVLNNRLNAYVIAHPIEVEYPNVDYNPTLGTPYLKVDLLPAEPTPQSIGLNSCNRHIGVYQILLSVPRERGLIDSKPIIDSLSEYFKRSTGLTYNGVFVRITRFRIHNYIEDDAWFRYPVSISYKSDLEN